MTNIFELVPESNWRIGKPDVLASMAPDEVDEIYEILASTIGVTDDCTYGIDEEWWEDTLTMCSYTADFETTTDPDDCRVWAVGTCEIGNPDNIERGTTLDWFMGWCREHALSTVYFHNLAFDGAFIMDWLERNGWEWVPDRKQAGIDTYTTVISDANQVYCIELFFTPAFRVRIMDSLKIVPLSIAQMAKAYGLPIMKGEIDYDAPRPVGHVLTEEETAYLDNDVRIAAMVMDTFLKQGLNKMTAGSNALSDFRIMEGGAKGFRRLFPKLDAEEDAFIRCAYRGGFTYADPRFRGREQGAGIVFDVNSLYPSVMAGCDGQRLPYGRPMVFEGKPYPKGAYNIWVAQVTCSFRVKPDHIPCIQLKGNYRFKQNEYLERSDGDVTFTITNVDWDLITQQYHVYNVRWHGGYYFKSATFLFRKYVDKWVEVKNQATIEGNKGQRQIAKLMLNSLYGKFATRTTVYSRRPMLVNDILRYVDLPPTERAPVYLPVGVFTTAYARYKTVTSAQSVYDRFMYADTDSIHLLGTDLPDTIEIDDVKLGAWKHESTFTKAKFLRAKCYIEYEEGHGEPTVHVAGMPKACHKHVTMDNFRFGAVYPGKLYTKRVNGGIVLVDGPIEIRE